MTELLVQIMSVAGAGLILAGYGLASRRGWEPSTRRSASVNLVGAALLATVAVYERQIGFVLLEGAWVVIAVRRLVTR